MAKKKQEKPDFYSPVPPRERKVNVPKLGTKLMVTLQGYGGDFRGTYCVGAPVQVKCEVVGYPAPDEYFSEGKFRVRPLLEQYVPPKGYFSITMNEVV